jgi:hypothetical protein
MQVTSTMGRIFHKDPTHTVGGETFSVRRTGLNEFLTVPDWLRKNEYFEQCVADGSIRIVEVKSTPTVAPPPDEPADIGLVSPPQAPVRAPRVRVQNSRKETASVG